VILAEKPMECVAIGAGKYFEIMQRNIGSSSVYEKPQLVKLGRVLNEE